MTTDDQSLSAVVNGEIYNYPDLRAEYERRGIRFRSHCDSEIVLHAYRADGLDAFEGLNGMFAFGLWDNERRRLLLVRDRLGIKPLYYLHDAAKGTLTFASEIKALLAATDRRRWRIDPEGLAQYLTYQNTFGDKTLFDGIRMVPPGHVLTFANGQCEVREYWVPRAGVSPGPAEFERSTRDFREIFQTAVRRHLMSDVPVAAYLSAGLDSTLVAATAAPMTGSAINTYTGAFADSGWYDEDGGARLVAERIGSAHTRVEIGASHFEREFDNVIRALDEPRMGMGAFSQYIVAGRAALDRKVILTGHGGDELFSGYPVFKMALLARHSGNKEIAAFSDLRNLRFSEMPHLAYFAMMSASGSEGRNFLPVLFSRRAQERNLQPDLWSSIATFKPSAPLDAIAESAQSAYERILFTYLRVYLPGLLVVEDKISMAHALESRTPYLDNEVVALSLNMPEEIKLHKGILKAVVKSAAKDVLPDALLNMPKRGFPTPLRLWLRGELAGWMVHRISGRSSALQRIFRPEYLKDVTEGYLSSWRRNFRPLDEIATHRMWMLLSLESWLRQTEEIYGVTLEAA